MHSFLGRVRSKTEFPSPPLSLNTTLCLPLAPRSLGFMGYWVNLVFLMIIPLLFMLILPVLFRSSLILSSMSIRNISKSIVIPYVNPLINIWLLFLTFPSNIKLQTSSIKLFFGTDISSWLKNFLDLLASIWEGMLWR